MTSRLKFSALYFIILFVVQSCSSPPSSEQTGLFQNFESSYSLHGERILADEMGVVDINKVNGLFVLSTEQDRMLKIYNDQFERLSSFGRSGRGPGEFLRAPIIVDFISTDSNIKMLVYDDTKRKIIELNLVKSIEENDLSLSKEFDFPGGLSSSFINDLKYVDEQTFVGMYDDRFHEALDQKRGGFIFTSGSEEFDLFSFKNLNTEPFDASPEMNLNNRYLALSPDRKKLYSALMFYPLLEIVDMENIDQPSVQIMPENEYSTTLELSQFTERTLIEYFGDVEVTENYVYLYHLGKMFGQEPSGSDQHSIQVITPNGEEVYEFLIDAKLEISRFVVDEENSRFIGLSWNKDAIYQLDFSKSGFTP